MKKKGNLTYFPNTHESQIAFEFKYTEAMNLFIQKDYKNKKIEMVKTTVSNTKS